MNILKSNMNNFLKVKIYMINLFKLKNNNRLVRKDTYFKHSNQEQFTGEYWINGKKIYIKTIKTTVSNINSELNSLSFDTLIYFFGIAKSNYNNSWLIPNTYTNESDYNITFNYVTNTRETYLGFGNYFGPHNEVVVIIKYTKK